MAGMRVKTVGLRPFAEIQISMQILGGGRGLSPVVRGCRKAGPAGLRGLLKSPPRRAGQASATLRATRLNPCRGQLIAFGPTNSFLIFGAVSLSNLSG